MATSSQDVRTFTGDYHEVFRAVCDATQAEKMTILSADPATGVINASSSMSAMSWGENVVITVGLAADGGVAVAVRSSSKFGLVDWGKNKKNLTRLYDRIAATSGDPSAAAPPPYDQSGRPSSPASQPTAAQASPASQPTAPQPAPAPAGAWHADPTGRHELRYWNGSAWTDHVSDQAVVSTDPV